MVSYHMHTKTNQELSRHPWMVRFGKSPLNCKELGLTRVEEYKEDIEKTSIKDGRKIVSLSIEKNAWMRSDQWNSNNSKIVTKI